jgi:hypothetical protein
VRRWVLAGAGLLAATSFAQVPVGPELQVNTYTYRDQYQPAVARLAGGEFIVAWTSGATVSLPTRVMGRRFSRGGRALGEEWRLGDTPGHHPQLLPQADGGFVVVWASRPVSDQVVAQRFDAQGARVGAEILVHEDPAGYHLQLTAAANAAGTFVVAWTNDGEIHAQRVSAAGVPIGSAFQVNASSSHAGYPSVAVASDGAFVVVWDRQVGYTIHSEIAGRRFTAGGMPLAGEFEVSTTPDRVRAFPDVAFAAAGGFLVVWQATDSPRGVSARRFGASGEPAGGEFQVTTVDGGRYPSLTPTAEGTFLLAWGHSDVFVGALDATGAVAGTEFQASVFTPYLQEKPAVAAGDGGFFVAWQSGGQFYPHMTQDGSGFGVFARRGARLQGTRLDVDASGNSVLEPGETVTVAPTWMSLAASAAGAGGILADAAGPPGATYSIPDAQADYGDLEPGVEATCTARGDCYSVSVSPAGPRPALHWDFQVAETLSPGGHADWRMHVGASFTDVATASAFYPYVETLLHHAVTGGCAAGAFCPTRPVTRAEMAAFLMTAREGPAFKPVPCGSMPFADVPLSHPFCPFIRYLAARGIAAGCGGGNYCPGQEVARQEMSVLVLRTSEPTLAPPPCATPVFADVPASSPFCPWIEESVRRGIVAGCGGGRYCPADPVTREQMAVFISATFGLRLYGP